MFKRLSELPWSDIEVLDRKHLAYVLPIGSTEQHGRHLPVGTDDLILQTSLDGLEKHLDMRNTFLRLPALHYGNSFEHLDFAGTMTLRTTTILAVIEDLLFCMKKHGVKYLVIVNSHGGNAPILHAQSQEWEQLFGIRIFNIDYFGSDFFAGAQEFLETPVNLDIHGGEIETSYFEHVMPDLIHTDRLSPEKDVLCGLKDYYYGWLSRDLSENNGLIGGASRSTQETGENLWNYMQEKLAFYFHQFDDELDAASN